MYLAKAAEKGMDVLYVITGTRAAQRAGLGATGHYDAYESAPPLTLQEAALLDNYRHAGSAGKHALDAASAALAKPAKKTG